MKPPAREAGLLFKYMISIIFNAVTTFFVHGSCLAATAMVGRSSSPGGTTTTEDLVRILTDSRAEGL